MVLSSLRQYSQLARSLYPKKAKTCQRVIEKPRRRISLMFSLYITIFCQQPSFRDSTRSSSSLSIASWSISLIQSSAAFLARSLTSCSKWSLQFCASDSSWLSRSLACNYTFGCQFEFQMTSDCALQLKTFMFSPISFSRILWQWSATSSRGLLYIFLISLATLS